MIVRRQVSFVVTALALGAVTGACGGSSPPEPKTPETTTTTAAQSTGAMSGSGTSTGGGTNVAGTDGSSMTSGATAGGSTGGSTSMGSSASGMGSGNGSGAGWTTGGGANTAAGTTTNSATGTTTSSSSSGTTSTLSDDQIAAITDAANHGEVEEARLAEQKAKDARVKRFAQMMIADHGAAISKQNDVVKRNKLALSDNPVSRQLQSDVESTMTSLRSQNGGDFDHAYIDAQVKQHQTVLDTIDQKLLPNVQNADLKAGIQAIRPKVEMHLKEARDIQKSLK